MSIVHEQAKYDALYAVQTEDSGGEPFAVVNSEESLAWDVEEQEWVPLSNVSQWTRGKIVAHLAAHQRWRVANNPVGLTQAELMERAPKGPDPVENAATVFVFPRSQTDAGDV